MYIQNYSYLSCYHTHLLSKLVPKLKFRKNSIIVMFDTQIILFVLSMSVFKDTTLLIRFELFLLFYSFHQNS